MGGSKDDVKETPQQRAMVEHATRRFVDWKQRWLPVQKNLINQITEMGAPGSRVRKEAAGRASTDTAMSFAKAQQGLQRSLTASGAGPGSSKFNLATAGAGDDQAASRGMGLTLADQQVDDAYVEGLSALMKIGRGESAQVSDSLSRMAGSSARQAATDAEISAMERAGTANLVGQVAGFGIQRGIGSMGQSAGASGSVPGGFNIDGRQFNNPSAYTAP